MFNKEFDVLLIKREGKYLLIQGNRVYNVNETSARIFDLCNGENTEKEIALKLSKIYDVPLERLENDTVKFLNTLASRNLIVEV